MHELELIATFLNLAVQKLRPPKKKHRAATGPPRRGTPRPAAAAAAAAAVATATPPTKASLRWLTDSDAILIPFGSGEASQETQLLAIAGSGASALWIANNNDDDTLKQKELLDALGVSTPKDLLALATEQGARTLQHHADELVESETPKLKFMQLLLGPEKLKTGEKFLPKTKVANPPLKIPTDGRHATRVPLQGLVFVTGTFDGTPMDSAQHAEQKLLAMLGDALLLNPALSGNIRVAGIKPACRTCLRVLSQVSSRLPMGLHLDYASTTTVNGFRAAAGLVEKTTALSALNLDFYFPPPRTATATPTTTTTTTVAAAAAAAAAPPPPPPTTT